MKRHRIEPRDIDAAMASLGVGLLRRLKEKGTGAFISSHETMGVITEEHDEAKDAVRDNDHQQLRKELVDIAVGCLVGIISIDSGTMEF